MPYYEYDNDKNIIVEVPDISESELQPPSVRAPGQPDEADPKFRADIDKRLRNWDIEHKM